MYYNTNKEEGQELIDSTNKSFKQEDIILGFFLKDEKLTREDVEKKCRIFGYFYPTSSVVRAISVLTSKGKLKKTNHMKKSIFNKKVHTWELV